MIDIDFRTRSDRDTRPVDFVAFHAHLGDRLRGGNGALAARGLARLGLPPLTIEVDGRAFTYAAGGGSIEVIPGRLPDALVAPMDAATFSELVLDLLSTTSALLTGRVRLPPGTSQPFLLWELVLRAMFDGRAIYEPGSIQFRDAAGGPLELGRVFAADDAPDEMSQFLRETGYLIIRQLFTADEMAAVSADIDRAIPAYRPGDGRSWWARTAAGEQLVRLKEVQHTAPTVAALLRDSRYLGLSELCSERYPRAYCVPGSVDACIKPTGIIEGISDMGWHKDCSLGRHSYDCCHLGIGFCVTDADDDHGQLCVVAGSHRTQVPLIRTSSYSVTVPADLDLPIVALSARAGDIVIHLGCVLHMAVAPKTRERRIMYGGFDVTGAGRPLLSGDNYAAMQDPTVARKPAS